MRDWIVNRRDLLNSVMVVIGGLFLGIIAGCGGKTERPTAHLAGALSIDGAALPDDAEGSITFKPTGPGQARTFSVTVTSGRYDAPHVPRGKVKAFVDLQQPTGRMLSEAGGAPYPEYRNLLADEHGTGILLDVNEDNDQQNFDLRAAVPATERKP